jgi:hypothetical protein
VSYAELKTGRIEIMARAYPPRPLQYPMARTIAGYSRMDPLRRIHARAPQVPLPTVPHGNHEMRYAPRLYRDLAGTARWTAFR